MTFSVFLGCHLFAWNNLEVALILLRAVSYIFPKYNGKLRQVGLYVVMSKAY